MPFPTLFPISQKQEPRQGNKSHGERGQEEVGWSRGGHSHAIYTSGEVCASLSLASDCRRAGDGGAASPIVGLVAAQIPVEDTIFQQKKLHAGARKEGETSGCGGAARRQGRRQ
jgi:hypothetical protein